MLNSVLLVRKPRRPKIDKKNIKFFLITFFVVLFDQITKFLVITRLELGLPREIFGDLFRFRYVRNYGALFSLSTGNLLLNRIIFTSLPLIIVIVVFFMIMNSKDKFSAVGFSLIAGGGIGNLIDRIRFGYVIDFLDSDFPNFIMERWPIFNIADSFVLIGIAILLIFEIFINKNHDSLED